MQLSPRPCYQIPNITIYVLKTQEEFIFNNIDKCHQNLIEICIDGLHKYWHNANVLQKTEWMHFQQVFKKCSI